MQDGALPHITHCMKQLLCRRFGGERIISRQFSTAWPPRFPDLNTSNFWLWKYLKFMVCHTPSHHYLTLKKAYNTMCITFLSSQCFQQSKMRFYPSRWQQTMVDIISSMFCTLLQIIYMSPPSIKFPSFHFAIIKFSCNSALQFLLQMARKSQV